MTDRRIVKECARGYKLRNRVNLYSGMVYDQIVFLDRANGNDGGTGEDWDDPVKTINGAINLFYGGARDAARGRNYAIVFRSRLTGGNAFTTAETQQRIDVPGVHLLGAGLLYGAGAWDSCYVTNSQIPTNDAHFSGIGQTRAGLAIEADNVTVQGMKFYCSDETNAMFHIVVHDRDQTNDSGNAGRNVGIFNCHFQGDVDGTAMINGVGLDGAEAAVVAGCRFQYTGHGIEFAGGGVRYCNQTVLENNTFIGNKIGIQGANATATDNIIQDNIVLAKGTYGWTMTYGIDGANSSTDNGYFNNIVSHETESTAYNYGTGNFWVRNYHGTTGGVLANPDT